MKDQDVSKTARESLQGQQGEGSIPKPLPASSSQIRVPSLTPKNQSHSKQRAAKRVRKWTEEPAHQEPIALFPTTSSEVDLTSKRVQRIHLKKPRDALQEMVRLQEAAGRKMGKISDKTQHTHNENVATDQDQLWRDLLKVQEERLFQIDRTIK